MQQIEPVIEPEEPSAYLDSNHIIFKTDDLTLGTLSGWGDYAHRGVTLPTVIESSGQKIINGLSFHEDRGWQYSAVKFPEGYRIAHYKVTK